MGNLKFSLLSRIKYGKKYVSKKKISAPPSYDSKYVSEVNNFYSYFKSFKDKEFRIKNCFNKKLKNRDSRKVIVIKIFDLFFNLHVSDKLLESRFIKYSGAEREEIKKRFIRIQSSRLSQDTLNKISEFIFTRPEKYHLRYLEDFANLFDELNSKRKEGLLKIQGNKFIDLLLETFEHKIAMQKVNNKYNSLKISDYDPVFEYIHNVNSDLLGHLRLSPKYKDVVKIKDFKKEKYSFESFEMFTLRWCLCL